jgi:hypothetical protein
MSGTPSLPTFDPTSLSPRAAAYFQNVFQPRFEQIRAQIPQTPFAVVLYGPGPGSLALYNKRVQIRDELRAREQAAFLAEELPQVENAAVLPRLQQLMRAAAADLVVVMVATMADFTSARDFNADAVVHSKLIIFAPDIAVTPEYRSVLDELERYDNVKQFRYPDDVVSCHLRTLVHDKLAEMQIAKWRAVAAVSPRG